MKTKAKPLSPFALSLRERITARITRLKREGVVGMSADNLEMLTVPKGADEFLPGAPAGTNARYYYRELFREVLATVPAAKTFIL